MHDSKLVFEAEQQQEREAEGPAEEDRPESDGIVEDGADLQNMRARSMAHVKDRPLEEAREEERPVEHDPETKTTRDRDASPSTWS